MAVNRQAVRVDGLRELRRFVRQLPDDVGKDGLKKIHDRVGEPVEDTAKQLVPRRTGRLAGSIRRAKGSTTRATVRAGRKSIPYAGVVEFGWPNRRVVFGKRTDSPAPLAERSFLREALDRRSDQVFDLYESELDRFIGYLMSRYDLRP